MTSGWLENLACYSAQIVVVIAASGLLRVLLRLMRPSLVLSYWQLTLAVCLALPILQPWQPVQLSASLGSNPAGLSFAIQEAGSSGKLGPGWPSLATVLSATVIAGVFARFIWTVVGLLRLRAIRRRAVWLPESGLPLTASDADSTARFYVSRELDRPATFGFFEPAILLPVRALELEERQLRCVLLHEIEHVRGRHWLFALFEEALQTVFWFHPAFRWLIGRIRLAREQVIDARVVHSTGRPTAYLGALLEMARAGAGAQLAGASSFLFPHELSERAALIIKETKMSRTRTLIVVGVTVPVLAFATLLAVWAFPLHAYAMPLNGEKEGESIQKTAPVYPPEAKAKGVQGTVVLKLKIDEKGKVVLVQPVEGPDLLVPAAADAVRNWTYKPVVREGKAVPVEKTVHVRFKLEKKDGQGSMRVEDDRGPGSHGVVGGVPGGVQGGVVGGVPGGVKGEVKGVVPGGVVGGVVGGVRDGAPAEPEGDAEKDSEPHPEVLEKSLPEYPPAAKEQHIEGQVVVAVTIDQKGQVTEASLVSGNEIFKDSAITAVRSWKWAPAEQDGQPVVAKAKITINYKLK